MSDNNFSGTQFTQFLALSANVLPASAIPEPGTTAALGVLAFVALRHTGRRRVGDR